MSESLRKKSVTQLRSMAQSFNIPDVFKKSQIELIQAIEAKQKTLVEVATELPLRPEYDARLMDKPPSRKSDREEIEDLLKPHVERGLNLTFDHERWYMRCGPKMDQGTLRMPLRVVLRCAENVMK